MLEGGLCFGVDADTADGPVMRRTPLRRVTPMRKKARKRSIGGLKAELWSVFSQYIRRKYADDKGMVVCASCPAVMHWTKSQAGHCLPKSLGNAVYFEERNVHPQCSECNLTLQGNQYRYALFLQKTYGVSIMDELESLRRTTRKIKAWEYIDMIADYRERLKKFGVEEAA